MGNKVTYGLSNVHYAVITEDVNGALTYGTPKALPGAVELSLEPRGDMTEFYADNILYYTSPNNQGYEGTLSIADITDDFAQDVLGEVLHEVDKVLTENSDVTGASFALMFQFEGDKKAIRHVIYNCVANRPTVSSSTKTDATEPNANELTFNSSPRASDHAVKTKTTVDTPANIYDAWFTTVYEATPSI